MTAVARWYLPDQLAVRRQERQDIVESEAAVASLADTVEGQLAPVAEALGENEERITAELLEVQGSPVDLGGYYRPDPEKVAAVMRPSATFNEILARLAG